MVPTVITIVVVWLCLSYFFSKMRPEWFPLKYYYTIGLYFYPRGTIRLLKKLIWYNNFFTATKVGQKGWKACDAGEKL